MSFVEAWQRSVKGMFPGVLLWTVLPLVPFMIVEQLRPVGPRPRRGDYALNIFISLSTTFLTLPVGLAAALLSQGLRARLPWRPLAVNFDSLLHLPVAGSAIELVAMVFVPLFLHDLWFYWAHRLEHGIPFLWEIHKLHHSDDRMNCASFARDHFLQAAWTAFFPILTLGMLFNLDLLQAGKAALYSGLFFVPWTMFCHSAIRVRLPGLDRLLVTPQVHRIHHSADPAHHNVNFADALPIFDILFGTYRAPLKDEFPATGLAAGPGPRWPWEAQVGPLASAYKALLGTQETNVHQ